MYEYFKGKISELAPANVVLEVAGIGYNIHISLNSYTALEGKEEATIFVEEIIREDAHLLYGFTDKQERELFRQLMSVSGVGANTANLILSAFSVNELELVISGGDVNAIKKVKGIGAKTAERLIVDLKDKIKPSGDATVGGVSSRNTDRDDAINALILLGYPAAESKKLVTTILTSQPTLTLDKIVKEALKMNLKK